MTRDWRRDERDDIRGRLAETEQEPDPGDRGDEANADQMPLLELAASRFAQMDDSRIPAVAAVKITPV
jgi:hypothetical protein